MGYKDVKSFWDSAAERKGLQSVMSVRWTDAQCREATRVLKKKLRGFISGLDIKSVFEIGCGIGRITELFKGYERVVAIDISEKMIERAKKRLRKFRNVEFIVGDFSKFQTDEKFDLVVGVTVLEHIVDEVSFHWAIENIKRMAKKYILLCEEVCDVKFRVGYSDYDIIRPIKLYLELFSPEFSLIKLERITCVEDGYAIMLWTSLRDWRFVG